jgi:hypothetical protein
MNDDTRHNETTLSRQNNFQHNKAQHNDTKSECITAISIATLNIMTVSKAGNEIDTQNSVMPSVFQYLMSLLCSLC